ncbi:MAG TPA: helix-turn-helix transcriptional regulator [Paraburkholderia sp.]|jgi:AraC-like DNA-binding protein|nr:helix-turn-helix transcriptional regulator [Paraburkholderia sp.]
MLVTFYLPYMSLLDCAAIPVSVSESIQAANVQGAILNLQRHLESSEDAPAALLQLQGDLQLSIGMEVDADESYREAQRRYVDKDLIRFTSCRNAGWQALFRSRYGTAMSCFMEVADHPNAGRALRLDALFGLFGVLFSVGRLRDADTVLDSLEALLDEAAETGMARSTVEGWRRLVSTVGFDVETQSRLRSRPELADHVYWQVGATGTAAPRVAPQRPTTLRVLTDTIVAPVLRTRIEFLERLTLLAGGDLAAGHAMAAHAEWAGKQGIHNYQNAVRIEMVLASLAGGCMALAESILTLLAADMRAQQSHRQLEYLYCQAKLRYLQGQSGESLELYTRYAQTVVSCIREESSVLGRYSQRIARPAEQLDNIGARLPARYRRAYRYLLDNLERKDLSIREIAAHIGVTDRALQSAFKMSLGSTPTEIIRRLRMERIRAELEETDTVHEQGILATAVKWGVSNRSTLITSYRREFNESPSDTLNR